MDKEKLLICVLCGQEWVLIIHAQIDVRMKIVTDSVHGDMNLQNLKVLMLVHYGKWTCKHPRMPLEDIYTELNKCKESPYYFATKYMTVNGKPFETLYSEEGFNFLIKAYENDQ